jgi:hypothetical protein
MKPAMSQTLINPFVEPHVLYHSGGHVVPKADQFAGKKKVRALGVPGSSSQIMVLSTALRKSPKRPQIFFEADLYGHIAM